MVSLKKLIKFLLFCTLFGVLTVLGLYLYLKDELPSVQSLKAVEWQTPMLIYSADGKLISQFGEKKRIPLKLEEMPQQLIDALLATEDDRFYFHFGVDPIGMARAVFGKIIGVNKGGGGTITMQVARNFFLTREQTIIRKIREIFLAFHIESLLTKDEILELYMNKIELGHRAFGFGAAAQVYYGKDVKELTLPQIAVLAGLPKAPSTMNPISAPQRAIERRAVVLQRMLVSGYITEKDYLEAKNAPVTAQKYGVEIELHAPYIAEMAHQEMLAWYGKEEAYNKGYKVYLTVSSELQAAAQSAVIENLYNYDERHGYRGPIKQLRAIDTVTTEQTNNLNVELEPLTDEEITNALAQETDFQTLVPAVVTEINEQSIKVKLSDLSEQVINWQGLAWAREYINDDKQGPAPKFASEIVHYGDVIYIKPTLNNTFRLSQLPKASAALVAMSPDNGAIQAAVGGFSFKQSQFNRAIQAKRQVGSNIKPFIYSAALEHNFTLASLVNDAPINKWDQSSGVAWRPKNSPPVYDGPIRVRLALAQSKNVIAVRLLRAVGLSNIIDHLSLFGFSPTELPNNESLALGSASLTPIEVATGFATFANGGFLVKPYLIERIEDSFGNIIFQANPPIACDDCNEILTEQTAQNQTTLENENLNDIANTHAADAADAKTAPIKPVKLAERVISKQNAFLVTQALNSAIWGADWSTESHWQGTGFRARSLNRRDIAGKTGTTNEAKDAWFSGFSRRIVATSWIGFDDHTKNLGSTVYNPNLGKVQTTGKEFGAKSAQPAWISFMETALAKLPEEHFTQPENILSVRIDKTTGKLTNKTDNTSTFEYFEVGTEPTEYVSQDTTSSILDGNKNPTAEELF